MSSIAKCSTNALPNLAHIPQPPSTLFYRGMLPAADLTLLTVVGSRRYTTYATQVIEHLFAGLTGYPIGIVSGLALGVDSLAHKAALKYGLYTMAVPGSGIADTVLYPARHRALASQILHAGGCLLSEFEPDFRATKWSFTKRNRIMAGMSQATLVIEAAAPSGTLITARLATDFNRELLVVPGNIFSHNSQGVHQFLKLGATPVTEPIDILHALNINPEIVLADTTADTANHSPAAKAILATLIEPTDIDTLIRKTSLSADVVSATLLQLEMTGHIQAEQGQYRTL